MDEHKYSFLYNIKEEKTFSEWGEVKRKVKTNYK